MKTKARHPFGELLAQYRARKPGLTQTRLAELAGYNQAIVVRMCQGKKDLTGPSGRERVVRLIETLADQDALTLLDEANALLLTADMPPLFERQPNEARLITRLSRLPLGQRVRRTNLPAPLTSFIGRAHEIAEARRLLGITRLLTLTGAGGSGKTRLAQRIAADVLIAYSEGVWYAELAILTDPALIPNVVAIALGLVTADQTAREQVLDYLRERHVLLVLDNCEHMIEAVALFTVDVLRACPRVTILTTSREALNVDGETAWRVPPMQPDEAGRLFVDRAVAARSDAYLNAGDKTIATICQRLDGMPLAIELAAAQLSSMSLSDIAERLKDRFSLLTGGRRGALPRHQTLHALIDWSYDLLTDAEKIVFRRLGVFVGGWELEQAQLVSSDDVIRQSDVLPLLTQLVRKSLVLMDDHGGAARFRFLETLREYALEKLAEDDAQNAVLRMHAEAYMQLTERSVHFLHGADQLIWLARLEHDYANVQAAMKWSLELANDALIGCRIVGALFHFWTIASEHNTDAKKWTMTARRLFHDNMPPTVHAWVLLDEEWFCGGVNTAEQRSWRIYDLFVLAGDFIRAALAKSFIARARFYSRDYPIALRLHEEAVDEARQAGADWELRFNLIMLGECLRFGQRDVARAERMYHESMQLSKAAGDMNDVAQALCYYISGFAMERLQFSEALRYTEEALELAQQTGDIATQLYSHCRIAESKFCLGDLEGAVIELDECIVLAAERLPQVFSIKPKIILSRVLLAQRSYVQAQVLLHEALVLHMRRDSVDTTATWWGAWVIVDAMAAVAAAQNQALHAARLRGVTDTLIAHNSQYRSALHEWEYAPYLAKARESLGDAAYEAAYSEGYAIAPEQAIGYVLNFHTA